MPLEENVWKMFQTYLGYTDEEMAKFKSDPRNEEVLAKSPALMNKTIVAEVVESTGCNGQHKVGDKFYMDGAGCLITKLCPKKMCIYALQSFAAGVFAMNELFYAGVDPNQMRFKRAGCYDVGVHCGGWGHIVVELKIEDRKKP
jgi:uncharacterized repeat protein (TIGR04076 family)